MIIKKKHSALLPHEICRNAITRGAHDIVFLDSNAQDSRLSGRSFIFLNPFKKISSGFNELAREIEKFSTDYAGGEIPEGAAAGYVTYDAGMDIENIKRRTKNGIAWPLMEFGLYDTFILFDKSKGEYSIVSTGLPEKTPAAAKERSKRRSGEFERFFEKTENGNNQAFEPLLLKSNFTEREYTGAVNRIKEYIKAGDVYQVNLSQKFSAQVNGYCKNNRSAFDLYVKIREVNPVPYGAFINFDGRNVLSFSMERFLKMNGRYVETRPIKGTLPRGRTPEQDAKNREKLLKSAKNQAELLMITDLERNDLGRSCEFGSVTVKSLYDLEEYATVFHLVSTVSGRLRKDLTHLDCFRNCFPGGSITGAPKIRSMEIIDELEKAGRGVYCGSIGYFGFNGVSDFNIAIRTIMIDKNGLVFNSGGGITYDSNPEQEYEETLQKVKMFFDVLGKNWDK